MRTKLTSKGLWVVKIGSAVLTRGGTTLAHDAIAQWVEQFVTLQQQGYQFVLVSSGAVAEGMRRLGWKNRPHEIYKLQAAAAVGQMGLIQAYESRFNEAGIKTAQVLLTHDDMSNRQRYLNARSAIKTMLEVGVTPIVNENDTVAVDEIRFGDNDTLAALVANLTDANVLVILTDQQGMYDKDPRHASDASLLYEVDVQDPRLDTMAGKTGGALGRGGMYTKLTAARIASRSGTSTIIASGEHPGILLDLAKGTRLGTLLYADVRQMDARRLWLAGQLKSRGTLTLDEGAVQVLRQQGKSLLAVGVSKVQGTFARGDLIRCIDSSGNEVGRGLVNYNYQETAKIIGRPSEEIEIILGYIDEPELIHRDNLVVL
jgi:glutamate 5-kinase